MENKTYTRRKVLGLKEPPHGSMGLKITKPEPPAPKNYKAAVKRQKLKLTD
jgi:hypothetical protein